MARIPAESGRVAGPRGETSHFRNVRKYRLLAENAVKENRFDSAVEEYEAGLEINPTWPEGHFNAALLYAELGYYPEAMHHMRAYLELTPEAPDAQQARDQVVIWEAKLR